MKVNYLLHNKPKTQPVHNILLGFQIGMDIILTVI
jgi:hypothetical protein